MAQSGSGVPPLIVHDQSRDGSATFLRTHPAEVAAHYDRLDTFYRAAWGEHVHHGYWHTGRESLSQAVHALLERAAAELELPPGACVCDIGCGYGATAAWLAQTHRARVTGLTVSPSQAAYARAHFSTGGSPEFLLADFLQHPFTPASFDAALALECAEHMPDKPAFFAQAHRALRPGGRLTLTGWQAGEGPGRWMLTPICRAARMPALYSEPAYRACAEAAGFRTLRSQDWTAHIRPTWPRIAAALLRHPALLPHALANWRFGIAAALITTAYHTRALRYGAMTFERA